MNMEQAYKDQFALMQRMVDQQSRMVELLERLEESVGILTISKAVDRLQAINGNDLATMLVEESDEPSDEVEIGRAMQKVGGTADVDPEEDAMKPTLTEIDKIAYEDIIALSYQPQLPYGRWDETYHYYTPAISERVRFAVNPEKRTVAVYMLDENGKSIFRGKAKCHPDDVYSTNVGAVIALRRMFKLEIPEVYIQAGNK